MLEKVQSGGSWALASRFVGLSMNTSKQSMITITFRLNVYRHSFPKLFSVRPMNKTESLRSIAFIHDENILTHLKGTLQISTLNLGMQRANGVSSEP